MISEKDTICAIATGTGSAGIGIVRLSGPDSIGIAGKLFRGKRKLSELKSYTAAYGHLVRPVDIGSGENVKLVPNTEGMIHENPYAKEENGEIPGANSEIGESSDDREEILDEVIALVMRAPHTYTTEDVVEFSCHGGPLVMRRVLDALVCAGARLAEPGEFTKRAYLGGRIDLTEAEAVMDVIDAENDRALSASLHQLRGGLRDEVTELREKILYETAYIESALDDPENYSLEDYAERISIVLAESRKRIQKLIEGAEEGRMLRQGIRTTIVGRPNAGKSSILNLLLGEERAIVTEIAGTTRDILEEKAILGGVELVLIDTAGIRETTDTVEKIGVQRAKAAVETADLILLVIDAAEPLSEEDRELLRSISEDVISSERGDVAENRADEEQCSGQNKAPILVLLNKNDLDTVVTANELEKILKDYGIDLPDNTGKESSTENNLWNSASEDRYTEIGIPVNTARNPLRTGRVLEISATTGDGKDRLAEAVQDLFFSGNLTDSQEQYILNARHKEALQDALSALSRVSDSVEAGVGEDFYTIDLLAAYAALGRITGETLEDDLADKIFAEFCMGK